jgi:hypothetical protein
MQAGGNVLCGSGFCFANPDARDFSPLLGGLLLGAGVRILGLEADLPAEDIFGVRRGFPPTAGAIEGPAGPLSLNPLR